MKIKILFIILLFSLPILGQTSAELNQKLKKINLQVRFIDSVANYNQEEVSFGEIKMSHGRIDGKPIRKLFTNTRTTKFSNQVIRICYRERFPVYDEDLSLYFFENKLIYAERSIWKERKNKFSMKKFYFENDIEISLENSHENLTEGIYILINAQKLMMQASR